MEHILLEDFLGSSPEYAHLNNLLVVPDDNKVEIQGVVQRLRKGLSEDPYLRKAGNSVTYYFPHVIQERQELIDEGFIPMTGIDPVPVDFIYHWAPNEAVEGIFEKGLLPAFCQNKGRSSYVYASFNPDSWWYWAYQQMGKKFYDYPSYEEHEKAAKENTSLIKIKVDPNLQAYTWAPKFEVRGSASPLHYWPVTLVSSKVLSLEKIMGYNVFLDEEMIENNSRGMRISNRYKLQYSGVPRDKRPYAYDDNVWKYSPWLDREVPPDAETTRGDEYTEILLDFVSPDAMELVT